MDLRLQQRLETVAARARTLRLARLLAAMWLGLAAVGGLLRILALQEAWFGGPALALFLVVVAMLLALSLWLGLLWQRADLMQTARQIEAHYPTLNERLLAAVHQRPQYPDGKFGYLQRQLIDASVAHDREHRWTNAVPNRRLTLAWALNLPAFVVFAAVIASLATMRHDKQERLAAAASALRDNQLAEPTVVPGDVEIERGSSVIVTAQFSGRIPAQVSLQRQDSAKQTAGTPDELPQAVADDVDADNQALLPMRRSLDDPLFAAYLTEVHQPLSYSIEYDGQRTRRYQVKVFDYPAVVRSDAELEYPRYTRLEKKSIIDTRRVSAVVGTELTWICHVNKSITKATLVDAVGGELALVPDEAAGHVLRAKLRVTESRVWQVQLVDESGRANKVEVKLSLKALPNEPPKIKLASGDVRVSPLEELTVGAKVSDDFGIERTGLTYQMVGGEETEFELPAPDAGVPKASDLSHIIAFESLEAEPDQLLSYYVWAEDRDSDGAVRRISSDIFFAEVRPFEEIFRQGEDSSAEQQQQQSQSGAGGSQVEELLELQKQIVAGTWNVLRKSSGSNLSDKTLEDVKVLADSQASAGELLAEKAAEINVAGGEELVAAAGEHMTRAINELTGAAMKKELSALKRALAAEQLAYQALLKLQAKEFEVSRSQQQSGQQSGSPRSRARQQQLDQLKLENRENRYENERLAQERQQPENSQLRQVQSRLRELAQRQEDLNEQIRELQAALQVAEDEQQRREIEKRLERLREQQQQMLEDADELREQLNQQTSSDALAEAQEQMEQTRENLRQSSEALDQGNTSQALSAGTRAEQELKELQEKVRQESAGQFSESMREMQRDAAELEQEQQALSEQLKATEQETGTGLRGSNQRAELEKVAAEQRERLSELLEQMRTTVEAAEEPEPLLAQRLYDTFRQTEQKQVDKKLQTTEQLLDRNLLPQAQQLAQSAESDLQDLRDGIDSAAEAVLGSEVDSLRLALDQLQQLSHQIDQELAEATGRPAPSGQEPGSDDQPAGTEQSNNSATEGQPADNQSQPNPSGQQQSGQQQSGQQQPGQQSGQRQPGQQSGQQQSGQPNGQPSQQNAAGQNQAGGGQPSQAQPAQAGLRAAGDATRPHRATSGQRTAGNGRETDGGAFEEFGGQRLSAPITGEGFREWSDRLREVEELVADPELRGRATQIRQVAREMRSEIKKHAADPQWNLVEELIAEPLRELQKQVSEELLRKAGDKSSLVPIDRDPVPGQYSESVRRYYENIGSGR